MDRGAQKGEGPRLFRRRDLLVLALAALALFMTLDGRKSYSIEPLWFVDMRSVLPRAQLSPVVTDLEGDGQNEVVLVSKDLKLQLLSIPTQLSATHRIETPEVLAEQTLLTNAKIAKGRAPVALGVGYLDEYDETTPRQQYIAVLREDWTLLLLDAKLNKMWERPISIVDGDLSPVVDEYVFSEVAITISAVAAKEGDRGMVIVGGSMVKKRHSRSRGEVDVVVEKGVGQDDVRDPEAVDEDLHVRSQLEHFSIFALAGQNGDARWHHKGQKVDAKDFSAVLPQELYKLDEIAAAFEQAPAIQDWTAFRQSLLRTMPHYWSALENTDMHLAHFRRRHLGANEKRIKTPSAKKRVEASSAAASSRTKARKSADQPPMPKIHLPGAVPRTAELPHSFEEHLEAPNVVVVKGRRGVEVFSLQNGRPITTLALADGVAYADVNGDNIIDAIQVVETAGDLTLSRAHAVKGHVQGPEHHDRVQACTLVVLSGLPPTSQLFNASACAARRRLDEPMATINSLALEKVSAAPPVLLTAAGTSKGFDIMTAVHTGAVASFTGAGRFRWQSTKGPTWSVSYRAFTATYHDDASRVDRAGTYNLQNAHAIVQGERKLVMFSSDGRVAASVELPHIPTAPPVLGDFDNDGVTDIIIVTPEALWGMKVVAEPAPQALFILCCILIVVVLGTFVANIRVVAVPEESRAAVARASVGPHDDPAAAIQASSLAAGTQKVARRKKVYHMDRSTDD